VSDGTGLEARLLQRLQPILHTNPTEDQVREVVAAAIREEMATQNAPEFLVQLVLSLFMHKLKQRGGSAAP
jgi:hypothetical protein